MLIAFADDYGKRVPVNTRLGHKANFTHQIDIFPLNEPNCWEIKLDV